MSLLQSLSYKDYKSATEFSAEQCERIAKLAELNIAFNRTNKPGEILMKALDRCGCTVERYKQLIGSIQTRTVHSYYQPKSKVAIMIANEKYLYLSKLATPSTDCDTLGQKLRNLGFIVFVIKDTISKDLKKILKSIFEVIPEDSYCFLLYAGHGCQLCNTRCMLGIECPGEDIQMEHCVTENYIFSQMERCKLDLCVFVMDMCRNYLDRTKHPQIYSSIPTIEDYTVHKNLIVTYSAQSAYEIVEIEHSGSFENGTTYELQTGDTGRFRPLGSLYINALCSRIEDDNVVGDLIDLVHIDLGNSVKKQRPIKLQCGTEKRSLYDPVTGDINTLRSRLIKISETFKDNCEVY